MLFWKFFFGLFIGGVIFHFVYSVLILPFALAVVMPIAKRQGNDNSEAGNLPKASWIAIAAGFLFTVYMVCGWAAFAARYASVCSQTPGVEHHWLYYLFGFGLCGGALASDGQDDANLPSIIAPVAFVIFCLLPALAELPYGWVLDRVIGSRAVAVSPADEAVGRGKAAATKEDWELAVTEYTKAIRLDPKHAEAYCCRGVAYGEKREWDKAIADLSAAIQLNPKCGPAYFQRGCAYLGKGSPSDGSLVGAFAWGFLGRGKEDFNRAVADLTEAICLKPDCGEAYYCRGAAYSALGETIKAEADSAEAKRLGFKPQ